MTKLDIESLEGMVETAKGEMLKALANLREASDLAALISGYRPHLPAGDMIRKQVDEAVKHFNDVVENKKQNLEIWEARLQDSKKRFYGK